MRDSEKCTVLRENAEEMDETDEGSTKTATYSGPWASEVESMKRNKKKKRKTEIRDVTSRRIMKGKRRIRSCVEKVNSDHEDDQVIFEGSTSVSKAPFTSSNTPCSNTKKVSFKPSPVIRVGDNNISGINAFDVAEESLNAQSRKSNGSKQDSPLNVSKNLKHNALQRSIFTKQIDSPMSESEIGTFKKRTRRNTYELQDTVNDLETLVNDSPAKILDDGQNNEEKSLVNQKKKVKTRNNGNVLQEKVLLNESYTISDAPTSSLDSTQNEELPVKKKRKNKKSKRNMHEAVNESRDNKLLPENLNTSEKHASADKKIRNQMEIDDELLMNESTPGFLNDVNVSDVEAPVKNKSKKQKDRSNKNKNQSDDFDMLKEEKQRVSNGKRNSYELKDTVEIITNSSKKNTYEFRESMNKGNNSVCVANDIDFEVKSVEPKQKGNTFEVDTSINVKKRKSKEINPVAEVEMKTQKRNTIKVDYDMKKPCNENCRKRTTFEISTDVSNAKIKIENKTSPIKSRKRGTFEIKSNVDTCEISPISTDTSDNKLNNEKTKKRTTFEIDPNDKVSPVKSRKRGTFEIKSSETSVINANDKVSPVKSRKRGTFEMKSNETSVIDPNDNKVSPVKSRKRGTFEMKSNETSVIDANDNKVSLVKSQKRGTFEMKSNKTSVIDANDNKVSPVKSRKRGTFEIKSNEKSAIDTKDNKVKVEKTKKRSTFEIDPNDSIVRGLKRKSKEIDPDDCVSREVVVKKRSTFEMKPNISSTQRRRRRGIYEPEKSTLLADESKINDLSVNSSSCGVFQLPSPWKNQSSTMSDSVNAEIGSENIFEKMKIPSPATLEKKPINKPSSQVKISTKKMPNYSLIHKKAFERMESLDDHLERKRARANALLSGTKVKIGITAKSEIKTPVSKKQLFLNKPQHNTPDKIMKQDSTTKHINRFKTPIKIKTEKENKTPLKNSVSAKKPNTPIHSKPLTKSKVPEVYNWLNMEEAKTQLGITTKNALSNKNVSVKFQTPTKTPISFSSIHGRIQTPIAFKTSSIPKTKPVKKVTPSKSNIPVVLKPLVPLQSGMTRFGFKMNQNVKNVDEIKARAIKAVATKTRTESNTVKERRNYIKGVRSNRRFDLLMNMRKMETD